MFKRIKLFWVSFSIKLFQSRAYPGESWIVVFDIQQSLMTTFTIPPSALLFLMLVTEFALEVYRSFTIDMNR